jgi:hypothetical protein
MTEAGVAWQQYDLSDSEADDVDVARSQDRTGGQGQGMGARGVDMETPWKPWQSVELRKFGGFWGIGCLGAMVFGEFFGRL